MGKKLEVSEMIAIVRALIVNQVKPMFFAYSDTTTVEAFAFSYFNADKKTMIVNVSWTNGTDVYYQATEEDARNFCNVARSRGVVDAMKQVNLAEL